MEDDLFNVNNEDDMNEEEDELDTQFRDQENTNENDENDDNEDNEEDDEDDDEDEEDDNDNDENDDENDNENDNDNDNDDGEGDDDGSNDTTKYHDAESTPNPNQKSDAMDVDSVPFRQALVQKAKHSFDLDIVPSVAIPYSGQCHAMAFTDGPKWIITGGEDGFIRKYDFMASVQGKSPLTMAQRHNLVDSVTNAGVICSYWENEQPMTQKEVMEYNPKIKQSDFSSGIVSYEPKINPVYSLDVERNGYWCLSGLLSGGISLYTMRYNEGTLHHYFRHSSKKTDNPTGHTDAVLCLKLNQSQDEFLSGSWDKSIRKWDLNTGKCTGIFNGSSGQISQIQFRPQGLGDLLLEYGDDDQNSDMGSLFGDSDNEKEEPEPEPSKNRKSNTKVIHNESVFMSSSSDGTVNIWDVRSGLQPVIKYGVPTGTPPWCVSSTWSNNGDNIYVGRRNSTVEELSMRMPHRRSNKLNYVPNVLKTLQFPKISGPVTAVSTMPNDNYLLCGSMDNIRLYNLDLYNSENPGNVVNGKDGKRSQATPFLIIPGHHGGVLSSLYVDETGRFMVSASGNRGWGNANFTELVLVYEIDFESK